MPMVSDRVELDTRQSSKQWAVDRDLKIGFMRYRLLTRKSVGMRMIGDRYREFSIANAR